MRDLAQFLVHCAERKLTGPFNAVCMPRPWGEFLEATREAVNPEAKLTWVPADFLAEHDVQAWRDLQMWVDKDGAMAGSLSWSSQKAMDAGLRIRPAAETARDTLAWFQTLPEERRSGLRSGLAAEKESAVLAAWHESKGGI